MDCSIASLFLSALSFLKKAQGNLLFSSLSGESNGFVELPQSGGVLRQQQPRSLQPIPHPSPTIPTPTAAIQPPPTASAVQPSPATTTAAAATTAVLWSRGCHPPEPSQDRLQRPLQLSQDEQLRLHEEEEEQGEGEDGHGGGAARGGGGDLRARAQDRDILLKSEKTTKSAEEVHRFVVICSERSKQKFIQDLYNNASVFLHMKVVR